MHTTPTTEKPKLCTASFIKICLVNFFIFVNFHALLPTFPFFITHLGGDAIAIGLATALFSLASIIARPFAGWLVDTKGRATILIISLIGMTIIPMGYFVSAGISFAVLLRTIHGAFHATSSNAASTWVTDIVPMQRMGEGLGLYGLSMALSTAIAPALGLLIMNKLGFIHLFIAVAAAGLLALLISITIKDRSYSLSVQPLKINQLFESFGAVQPSLQTMAMRTVPPQRRGAASSTFFVAFDLGIALGGLLSGILVKYFGYDVMFIAIAICGICSSGYFYFFASRQKMV